MFEWTLALSKQTDRHDDVRQFERRHKVIYRDCFAPKKQHHLPQYNYKYFNNNENYIHELASFQEPPQKQFLFQRLAQLRRFPALVVP